MKRIRCPKCDESILFDETLYAPGRILVFTCPTCQKQFKIRMPQAKTAEAPTDEATDEHEKVWGKLIVIENAFHFKQEIPLRLGENVIGRLVKGSRANAAFKTVDPSVDTTHCIITVSRQGDTLRFVLRDAPSNTGTFVQDKILNDRDRVVLSEGDIITIGATTLIFHVCEEEESQQSHT